MKHWTDYVPRICWILSAVALAVMLLGGCSHRETTADIEQRYGKPYGIMKHDDGTKTWHYDTMYVRFLDGEVVEKRKFEFRAEDSMRPAKRGKISG